MTASGSVNVESSDAMAPTRRTAERRDWWPKTAWPLFLACGFLIFISGSSIYLVVSSQSSRDAISRALDLESKLWSMLSGLRVAESEQRGYLLTGDPAYLDISRISTETALDAITEVNRSVADKRADAATIRAQQRVVAEIEPLLVRKFAELRETIRLQDSGDRAAALALVQTDIGRQLAMEISKKTRRMIEEQRQSIQQYTTNGLSTNIFLLFVNIAGLALIIVLAMISVLIVRRMATMEARYHGLLEAAPAAMVVVDEAGEIALVNLQAERDFGYRRDELLGQKLEKIIPAGIAAGLIAGDLRSALDKLTVKSVADVERTGRRKDGGEFPIEIMLSTLARSEGLLVIRDISVRRHAERLKDEFVATVSHELRTPLTSISGSLSLLVGQWASKLPESARRLLEIANTNSQRLVRLINDILDIEKLESGRVIFNFSQVAVRSLVEQSIEDNRGFADSYGVRVRLDPAAAEVDVNADADRLAQIVTNLLSNAIKFSPADGEVAVTVEKNGGVVRVAVRDHGFGISDDFKPHIFEKFAQADATNTRQKGGTGLGLSIVKQIVERMGGSVGFDDAPGGGAIFYVELPAWDGSAGGEIDLDSDGDGVRILYCEDDCDAAIVVRQQLRQAGFAVDFAHTVAAAVARTDATRYAAILVDLRLPDGDGVGLIVRLRAHPHYRDTPIIVIAGDPDQGRSDVRSSRLKILRWLTKPVSFESLFQILGAAIALQSRDRPRILHVDDDRALLALVAHEFRAIADVISADSLQSARHALATGRIDLAVLDITVGVDSGLDLLPHLRDGAGNPIPVMIFSAGGAGPPCGEHVQITLSKTTTSLDGLGAAVRDRLAQLPARRAKEIA